MNETQRGYASYLLRMWQAQDNGDWVWRASLESSQTGQRRVFASLNDLMVFVQMQADGVQDSGSCLGHKEDNMDDCLSANE